MSEIELLNCPFCGGKAKRIDIEDGENAGGSCICCTVCNASGNLEFGFKENFVDNWNRRRDLSQASVAAALEAAAAHCKQVVEDCKKYNLPQAAGMVASVGREIRALITPAQHDALAAHVAAGVAKARAEDAEMLAESRAYALALQEELRVRTAKLERECRLTQAQVDRMLVNSTQMHTDLSGCKIALEQAWASNRERAAKITALTEAMTELRAMVVAECPSLLNEDSGGNGELSCQINDLLTGEMTMKTAVGKAAYALLEHIVYYDLVERRGTEIADAMIAELVEIGVKSALTPTAAILTRKGDEL